MHLRTCAHKEDRRLQRGLGCPAPPPLPYLFFTDRMRAWWRWCSPVHAAAATCALARAAEACAGSNAACRTQAARRRSSAACACAPRPSRPT